MATKVGEASMNEHTIQLNAALSIFDENLVDIKEALSENILHDLKELQAWPTSSDATKQEIYTELIKLEREGVVTNRSKTIKRIVSYQQHKLSPKHGSITDEMIERAKEYPIKEMWAELVNSPIRGGMTKCCFHPDKTASMSLRMHNRYRCFGCDERGSVIDLYMKINKVNFIQAVKALQ
jgi:hypothetical protein